MAKLRVPDERMFRFRFPRETEFNHAVLRKAMTERGISGYHLSRLMWAQYGIAVTPQTINNYASGRTLPRAEIVSAFADIFNIDWDEWYARKPASDTAQAAKPVMPQEPQEPQEPQTQEPPKPQESQEPRSQEPQQEQGNGIV